MKARSSPISILDKGCKVEGKITAKGQLIIKGAMRGTLMAESVIVAEEGVVHAEAKVGRMTVGGQFEGSIHASLELVVLATGRCSGKIVCRDFVVEPGGVLNADVSCTALQQDQASGLESNVGAGERART